jgi:hypothetical protein
LTYFLTPFSVFGCASLYYRITFLFLDNGSRYSYACAF